MRFKIPKFDAIPNFNHVLCCFTPKYKNIDKTFYLE